MRSILIYRFVKRSMYHVCKGIGLFHLSRYLTRSGLRILCYHGFEILDESRFLPRTFISKGTFDRRLAFLRANRFQVLGLGTALGLLERGELPPSATVITIDDGFSSTYSCAYPILKEYSFPATVYITTYYSAKERPVFRLAVQYMFWKGRREILDMEGLCGPDFRKVSTARNEDRPAGMWDFIRYGEESCNEERRAALLNALGARLGVDSESILSHRIFHLVTLDEVAMMHREGIDIQLHTHRHAFPREEARAKREIRENREVLSSVFSGPLEHFCYPSGFWSKEQWPWLAELGIKSAVTCEAGLNYANSPALALGRFIDGEDISQIEFEAELFGFAEVLRKLRSVLALGHSKRSPEASTHCDARTGESA